MSDSPLLGDPENDFCNQVTSTTSAGGSNASKKKSMRRHSSMNQAVAAMALDGACMDAHAEEEQVAGCIGIVVISFLCTFMGAADGLSLGGLVFPSNASHPNSDFKHLGMCLGLLTSLVANFTLAFGSGFRFAVGGAVIPMVAVMAGTFKTIGPSEPDTILAAIGLVSFLCGVLFIISGSGVPMQEVLDYCPYVVFGGFLAGTGVLLLNFGFNLLVPAFTSILDFGPNGVRLLCTFAAGKLVIVPLIGAISVFFVDRWELAPRSISNFVLPLTMVFVAVGFYIVLIICGMSLDDARADGWLFETDIPKELDFYRVWTQRDMSKVKLELIFSASFFIGVLKSYLIGLLTLTQNIYGTKVESGVDVQVDRELRLHGWLSIACGSLGALPGCLVMGFSCTAKKLGISRSSRAFPACLVFFSVVFFVFGSYIIAVTPKMVIGLLLIWLGIVFSCYWLYDTIGKVPATEHLVVLLMTIVDVVLDSGIMIVVGLFAAFSLNVKAMAEMRPCTKVQSLGGNCDVLGLGERPTKARSDVMRCGPQFMQLEKYGMETVILTLRDTQFTTCAQLLKRLKPYLESELLRIVVFDMSGHLDVGVHFMNFMVEFTAMAKKSNAAVILAALHARISQAFESFGIAMQFYQSDENCQAMFASTVSCGTLYVIAALRAIEVNETSIPPVVLPLASALELAEELTLARHPAQTSGSFMSFRSPMVRDAIQQLGMTRDDPELTLFGMLLDLGLGAEGIKRERFSISVVRRLAKCFRMEHVAPGSEIFPAGNHQNLTEVTDSSMLIPPLIIVVEGEVEHFYMDSSFNSDEQYPMRWFLNYAIPPRPARTEKIRVTSSEREIGECSLLATYENFVAEKRHPYRAVAIRPTLCALLGRGDLSVLMREDGEAAELLMIFLARVLVIRETFLSWQRPTIEAAWQAQAQALKLVSTPVKRRASRANESIVKGFKRAFIE